MADEVKRWQGDDFTPATADELDRALHIHRRKLTPKEEEPSLQGVGIAELESLRQLAHEEGFAEGRQEGFEAGHKDGIAAGRAEGYQAGLEQGLKDGQQQIQDAVSHWQQLADELSAPLEDRDQRLEGQLVTLLVAGMEAVLGHELKTHPEQIHHLIRQGIDALADEDSRLIIEISPLDGKILREVYDEQALADKNWKLVDDPALKAGQCRIEAGQSAVSLDLHQRLRQLTQNVLVEAGLNDGEQ
ncbi:flagellar assembly protein FliH [Gallaecimonas sp. GXIMD1310]|uniref:flagellar assembly protein FliH n=1 Tax=Gallaecimonas sp. GXIMD1310 TaxID=3131926 RepID=UPI00325259F8